MGLLVDVYRASQYADCTAGGISSKAHTLCLVNVSGPFEPSDSRPAAMLVRNAHGTVRIVPAEKMHPEDTEYVVIRKSMMMGGNYAATSDSRFSAAVSKLTGCEHYGAVAIHDRHEG